MCPLRLGELRALRVEDVKLATGIIVCAAEAAGLLAAYLIRCTGATGAIAGAEPVKG